MLAIIRGNQTRLYRAWCLSHRVSLGRVEVSARLAESLGSQGRSEKNFLFVSHRRAKNKGEEPDFRGVTPYLIL